MTGDVAAVTVDGNLDLARFAAVAAGARVVVPAEAWSRMEASAAKLDALLAAGAVVYGVTTAYGAASGTPIPFDRRPRFQLETLRSHACGTGADLDWAEGRGVWLAKLASLATGRSGARPDLARALADLLNAGLAPAIPETGSLGASGDLIPSAHAALPLVGEGQVLSADGHVGDAGPALIAHGIEQVQLGPRDGLSLVNGTSVTVSLAAHACLAASRLAATAEWLAAAGLEAIGGHQAAFSEPIAEARPHPGVAESSRSVRAGLAGVDPARLGLVGIHDAYAWRCLPQVHGAARHAIAWSSATCQVELTSCSDNPIIAGDGSICSGGNFHGAPLGLAMETLRLATAEVCGLSRQRISQLASRLEGSGGPGLTMVLTSATSSLLVITSMGTATGHWLPVDSVEDHVSNATLAARRARDVLRCGWLILAAEAVALANTLPLVPTSAAACWVLGLVEHHALAIRLDQPLSATLTTLAGLLCADDIPWTSYQP